MHCCCKFLEIINCEKELSDIPELAVSVKYWLYRPLIWQLYKQICLGNALTCMWFSLSLAWRSVGLSKSCYVAAHSLYLASLRLATWHATQLLKQPCNPCMGLLKFVTSGVHRGGFSCSSRWPAPWSDLERDWYSYLQSWLDYQSLHIRSVIADTKRVPPPIPCPVRTIVHHSICFENLYSNFDNLPFFKAFHSSQWNMQFITCIRVMLFPANILIHFKWWISQILQCFLIRIGEMKSRLKSVSMRFLFTCSSFIVHLSSVSFIFLFILQVLTDPDHCYCVLLNADGGAAFPSERTAHDSRSSGISSLKSDTGSGNTQKTKVWYIHQFSSHSLNSIGWLLLSIAPLCMVISGISFVCITFLILTMVEPTTFFFHFHSFCLLVPSDFDQVDIH